MHEPPRRVRILIADDHPIFRDGLRKLLEAEPGFEVVGEAGDGHEAVDLVARLNPDVLLLDLSMPRCPGLEALREIAAAGAKVRAILLTAEIEKPQVVEALKLGARGVVLKQSATRLVLKCVRCVMDGEYWIGRDSMHDLVGYLQSAEAQPVAQGTGRRFGLTARELEVVKAIAAGSTNRDVARKFGISQGTVKHHLTSIFDKLGVSNRLELALFAVNHGLVSEDPSS